MGCKRIGLLSTPTSRGGGGSTAAAEVAAASMVRGPFRGNIRFTECKQNEATGTDLDKVAFAKAMIDNAIQLITTVVLFARPKGRLAGRVTLEGFLPADRLLQTVADDHRKRLQEGYTQGAALDNKRGCKRIGLLSTPTGRGGGGSTAAAKVAAASMVRGPF